MKSLNELEEKFILFTEKINSTVDNKKLLVLPKKARASLINMSVMFANPGTADSFKENKNLIKDTKKLQPKLFISWKFKCNFKLTFFKRC